MEDQLESFDGHYSDNLNNIEAYTLELTLMQEFSIFKDGE